IKGVITDAKTGERLPGVAVYLPELSRGAVSGLDGIYWLKQLPEQQLTIQVSYVGYKNIVKTIDVKGLTELNFSMEQSSIGINEVVVSAGRALSKEETPFAIETISPNEIFQTGNITMMDGISSLAGVNQITYGAGIGKPVIRGLSFSRILTIYQGARFENQQWGEDHGLGLNDPGIQRVEVIKGPASLIYGSGAVGGVINIIDEYQAPPGEVKTEFLQNFYLNTLGSKTSIGVKGANEKGFFWNIRPGFESHADYLDGNGRTIGNSRFNNHSIKLAAGLSKEKSSTKISYVYFDQMLGIIEEDEMENSLAGRRNDRQMQLPFQHVKDHLIAVQHSQNFRKGTFKLNLSGHQNIRKEIEDDMEEIDLGLVLSTINLDAKYQLPLTPFADVVMGVQSFFQTNRNMADAHEILMPDADVNDFSVYGLLTKKIKRFSFQGGARYDLRRTYASSTGLVDYVLPGNPESGNMERIFSGFSGSSGITFKATEKVSFKANVASGFRAPDLAELFSNGEHPGTNRFEMGHADFGREQNLEFDLSSRFHTNNLSIEIAGFYNLVNNYIFFNPTNETHNNLTIWKFEQEDVLLTGGEAGFKYNPSFLSRLEITADYSLVYAFSRETGLAVPQIPANRLNNNVKFNFYKAKPIYLNFKTIHVSGQNRVGEHEFSTPGYTLLGAGLSTAVKVKKSITEFNLSVNNLTNRVYFDHLAVTRPFGVPNIGRNVVLSLKFMM
ncbi:MAG: TonB-dependent receptor, partial [Bacteroidetes bacterium]|nr:TonB-dependent receptor [Bacteroidota bacterium]